MRARFCCLRGHRSVMSVADQRRPRVSAIIPAYNGEAFVADAIESVLAQTISVDEIVVIDDGSTDGTAEVAQRYASRGVRCIRQENRGLSAARNRGIAETSGELVAFLDCDDTWLPGKTALQTEHLMARPQVGLVAGHIWWWDPQSNRRWLQRFDDAPGARLWRELMIRNCVGNASGVMVRRRTLEEVGGFDPKQIWAEDWEMWMRVLSRWQIGFIDQPMIVYRTVSTSLTHQRRWDRVHGYFELSCESIRKFSPRRWRPILLARAWSRRELGRAVVAIDEGLPRGRYLRHTWRALVSYPLDETRLKLKYFVRVLMGESLYRAFKR